MYLALKRAPDDRSGRAPNPTSAVCWPFVHDQTVAALAATHQRHAAWRTGHMLPPVWLGPVNINKIEQNLLKTQHLHLTMDLHLTI